MQYYVNNRHGRPLTHPHRMEAVQSGPDDPADVPEDHLHADDAPGQVEDVNQRRAGTDHQQHRQPLQHQPSHRLHPVVDAPHRDQQGPYHDGSPGVLEAAEPRAAQASEGVLEGVEEGAAQHCPEQRAEEGLQDEVDQHGRPAADRHEDHRPGVVEGLLDVFVKLEGRVLGQEMAHHADCRLDALGEGDEMRPLGFRTLRWRDGAGGRQRALLVCHVPGAASPTAPPGTDDDT